MKIRSLHTKLFVMASIALLAMNTYGMNNAEAGSADGTMGYCGNSLTPSILNVTKTYFTPERIERARLKCLLTEETQTFLETASDEISTILTKSDTIFSKTHGYHDHKKKMLASLEQFAECLGKELYLPEKITAMSAGEVQTLCEELENLNHELVDSGFSHDLIAVLSPEMLHSLPDEKTNDLQKKRNRLLQVKMEYLKKLKTLDEAGKINLVHGYEEPRLGLTLAKAYQAYLICIGKKIELLEEKAKKQESAHAFDMNESYLSLEKLREELKRADPKTLPDTALGYIKELKKLNNASENILKSFYETADIRLTHQDKSTKSASASEQLLKTKMDYNTCLKKLAHVDPTASKTFSAFRLPKEMLDTYYHGLAINIRGALYELEAALQAHEHGKTIIAFGPEMRLLFDPATNKKVVDKIQQCPFLHPEQFTYKGITYCSLKQEFDLVTKDALIECKCTEDASAYIENLQREKFMAEHVSTANHVMFTSCPEITNRMMAHAIKDKPVVCYTKYADNFLKKEQQLLKEKEEAKVEAGDCTKDFDESDEELDTEIEELAERTLAEGRHREHLITRAGFSLWNGKTYVYTLSIPSAYQELPDIEELARLKKTIKAIDNEKLTLSVLAPKSHRKEIAKRLKEVTSIYAPQHTMSRSPSMTNLSLEETKEDTDKAGSKDLFDHLREPLPLYDAILIDSNDGTIWKLFQKEDSLHPVRSASKQSPACNRTAIREKRLQLAVTSPKIAQAAERHKARLATAAAQNQAAPAAGSNEAIGNGSIKPTKRQLNFLDTKVKY